MLFKIEKKLYFFRHCDRLGVREVICKQVYFNLEKQKKKTKKQNATPLNND